MSKKNRVFVLAGNGSPLRSVKFDRDAPYKCGSGKKQKNCCGCETKFFNSKAKYEDKLAKIAKI